MSMTELEEQTQFHQGTHRKMNLEAAYQQLTVAHDPQTISDLSQIILSYINFIQGGQFEASLHLVLKILAKGYGNFLTQLPQLTSKIMDHFVLLSKNFKKQPSYDVQYRLLFMASILAEFVRQIPKFELPFKREFLTELFEIEVEDMIGESRQRILAILGVLYSNLSKQSHLLKELKVEKLLKEAILLNYLLIEQSFTNKLFNQCIIQLQTKKLINFTLGELERYGIKKALIKTMGADQAQLIGKYLEKIFGKKEK